MGVVVDTSALIAVERAGEDLVDLPRPIADETAVIPAIVYAELQVGARLAGDTRRADQRRARIDAIVSRIPVVEFDVGIADRWADLFAQLARARTMIPTNDLQVAATAFHLDFSVLLGPRGDAHFEKVPGLRILRLPAASR